jgi:hypothetical protein
MAWQNEDNFLSISLLRDRCSGTVIACVKKVFKVPVARNQ